MPEVIFPPKEFNAAEFGLPEDARPELIDPRQLESQCGGTNESQNVETYDGTLGVSVAFVNEHQRAVGQTMRGVTRSCSGTLIGADLFLSAGHCFDPNPSPQTQVTFNFQTDPAGNPRPEQRFPILQVLEHRLGDLDYEIIRLGGNPAGTFGFALVSPVDAAVGDTVCIIGHPATAPKQVEVGPVTAFDDNQIHYNDADTLPGNSGSGVLHAPSGRIVGVHITGGCAGTTPETGFNVGVRISALIAASPILQGLVDQRAGIFASVFEQGGPAFVGRHNLTSEEHQQAVEQFASQGFRLTCVSGYTVNGQPRFASVFEQGGPAFVGRHNLTSEEHQQAVE
ncbi:MAG: trypsin-like peptidase domain-containing protein, partial [Actinomycetota bacterium]|nr:trypsin-like peptidase domain-containing protein [Actinomycetota bacterium]